MNNMRIGINATGLVQRASVPAFVEHAKAAEADGFDSYWIAEHPTGGLDALTVLALVGQHVTAMELGTAIVPTYPRHPMALAAQALTTQSAIASRLTLGIGLSHQTMMTELGLEDARPIRHLIDHLSVLMPLLDDGRVDFEGETLKAQAAVFKPQENPPQVVVAALGPQTLRVAGARTAGTSLAWVGPQTVRDHVAPTIRAAAEKAGRPAPRIIATLPICVTDDPERVREQLAPTAAFYSALPSYQAMFEREGLTDPTEIGIFGSADQVQERLAVLADAGVTDFAASEFAPLPQERQDTRELLRSLAATHQQKANQK